MNRDEQSRDENRDIRNEDVRIRITPNNEVMKIAGLDELYMSGFMRGFCWGCFLLAVIIIAFHRIMGELHSGI